MASGSYDLESARTGPTSLRVDTNMETPSVIIATPGGGTAKLPPLDGSRLPPSPDKTARPLPPIDPGLSSKSPGSGGRPEYGGTHTIISVPEGDGHGQAQKVIRKEKGHEMMSIPKKSSGYRTASDSSKAIDTIVYLMDKSGIQFTIEDGQTAEAGELFEFVMDELQLPGEARDVFSLWMVSDLLELQLKPTQVPFKLACYWDELLEKYTSAPEDDIERDEPIIMFQRNVFYSRSKERKVTDAEILKLLFYEAKENVVDARYPLKQQDCDNLAGLQAHVEHKGYLGSTHTPEYYKDKVGQFYPSIHAKKKRSLFTSKEKPEERLANSHRSVSKRLAGQPLQQAYREYLEFCWDLPYYGSAFFRGQIEHPNQGRMWGTAKDDPVYIAINLDGVFIIDMDDVEFLLGLVYSELKWEFALPSDEHNRDCMPCLFLEFCDTEDGEKVNKILQIFSREAMLMDAMIDSCIELKKYKPSVAEDTVDGPGFVGDEDGDGIIKAEGETWRQFDRLSLATYKKGKCVKVPPSMKKKK